MLRFTVLLAFSSLTAAAAQGPGSGSRTSEAPEHRLMIRLYNLAGVSSTVLRQATSEASDIFAEIGVEAVWELSDPDDDEAHTVELNSSAFIRANKLRNPGSRSYVAVRIGRGLSGGTPDLALGISLLGVRIGVDVTIFEDRVENLCSSSDLNLSVLLGHVIAHELGHVLLESPEHAATGIMRGRWGSADFRQAAMGHLRFSSGEAAAIRYHGSVQPSSRNVAIPVHKIGVLDSSPKTLDSGSH